MFFKILLANSLREDIRILIFRPDILNRQVSLPHQLAQEVVPHVNVLTVRRTQLVFSQVYRPFVAFKHSNTRRPQTGRQRKHHSSHVKGFLHHVGHTYG